MSIRLNNYLRIFYIIIHLLFITKISIQQDFSSYATKHDALDLFYQQYKLAKHYDKQPFLEFFKVNKEDELYKIFSDENTLIKFYYENNLLKDYIISFPNRDYVFFQIIVDPCKTYNQLCCEGLAICEQDNTEIKAGGDLEIAWSTNNLIPICENEFDTNTCGTFIEIHLPGNPKIINEYKIENYYVNGFSTIFISTKKMCSGRYELWIVFRMRGGNFLNYVKPIFVKYPSCTCEYVMELGYKCN